MSLELEVAGLVLAAFFAGFVDAVAGGGGLIQVPALLGALPDVSPATVFGTNKLSSIFGTASATIRYVRRISIPLNIAIPAAIAAFIFSFLGAASVAWFPVAIVKPVVLFLLLGVVVYVTWQPEMGAGTGVTGEVGVALWRSVALGCLLGFYDGFFGPGTGSFLIFCFVRFFGMNFIQASGTAKVVNLATNAAALSFFIPNGYVLFGLGAMMAVANVMGAQLGARAALKGGSLWVRRAFLAVSLVLIAKLGLDIARA